jgi:hypothetical protein
LEAISAFVNGSIFLKRFLIRSNASSAFSPSVGAFLFLPALALSPGGGTGILTFTACRRRIISSRFRSFDLFFATARFSRHGRQVVYLWLETGARRHRLHSGSGAAEARAVYAIGAKSMFVVDVVVEEE